LGHLYFLTNSLDESEECYRNAAALDRGQTSRVQLDLLHNLGVVYQARRDWTKAISHFEKALELARQLDYVEGEITIQVNLGYTHLLAKSASQALEFQNIAVGRAKIHGDTDLLLRALAGRGDTLKYLGQFDEANSDFQAAIEIIERVRQQLVDESNRISFFGAGKPALYNRIVLLFTYELHRLSDAFAYVERSRSRAFVDLLSTAMMNVSAEQTGTQIISSFDQVHRLLAFAANE
jgi:tetratricopeptide (TPR) repeat protein